MSNRHETIRFLTFDEIKRLLAVITNKRDRAIFLIAYRRPGPGAERFEAGKKRWCWLLGITRVSLKEGPLDQDRP